jgi:hypothetical protein
MVDSSLEDDLARLSIDQLHEVVLQLSGNCFETKKLCATIIVSATTLVATFLNKQLDASLFWGGGFIALFFWLLDAQSYYYQDKLRAHMKILAKGLALRQALKLTIQGVGMPLTDRREQWSPRRRALHAAFNASMIFYLLLCLFLVVLATLVKHGVIHAFPGMGQPS